MSQPTVAESESECQGGIGQPERQVDASHEMAPVIVGPNQPKRFYRGGSRIHAFRGEGVADGWRPEDWVGSTTTLFGETAMGLTALPDGTFLRDAIRADPLPWLGPAHVGRHGDNPALLVKLLDAGQRLPVHVHPTRDFAKRHLRSPYGKAEAWVILEASNDAAIFLGFVEDIDRPTIETWVRGQDTSSMLRSMNRIPVRAGDGVFVPAGTPHALSDGIFLLEAQEPTDYSVLLEWQDFAIDGEAFGHLGLGLDIALGAVDLSGWSMERLRGALVRLGDPVRSGLTTALPASASAFFQVDRLEPQPTVEIEPGFGVLVITAGTGRISGKAFDGFEVTLGMSVLVPYGAGRLTMSGDVKGLISRPSLT